MPISNKRISNKRKWKNLREKVIYKINKDLSLNIPLSAKIKINRQKNKDAGELAWCFCGLEKEIPFGLYGSQHSLSEMCKDENYKKKWYFDRYENTINPSGVIDFD